MKLVSYGMPKNTFIYYGLLVIVAAAAIFAGSELSKRIEFAVPYVLGFGILLVIVGVVHEARKKRMAPPAE